MGQHLIGQLSDCCELQLDFPDFEGHALLVVLASPHVPLDS